MLDVKFAYSSNGEGFAEHDFLTGKERTFAMDEFPTKEMDGDTQNYLMGAVLCLIAYLGIRRIDDKNKEKIEHLSALLKVYGTECRCCSHCGS